MILNRFIKEPNIKVHKRRGFALPTVLAASVIMLTVLVAAITFATAMRISIKNQYYHKLMKTANQAGVEFALACVNSGQISVAEIDDDGYTLSPGDNCDGSSSLDCDNEPTTEGCYVAIDEENNLLSTFEVDGIELGPDDEVTDVDVTGSVELLRESDDEIVREYTIDGGYTSEDLILAMSWKQVSVGSYDTCAISADDQIYCWGSNAAKWLNDGTTIGSLVPVKVSENGVLNGKDFKMVSVGTYSTCAIDFVGDVYCWGSIPRTNINIGVAASKINAISGVRSIDSGDDFSCVINNDEKVYCWESDENTPSPVLVSGEMTNDPVTDISVGADHACAISVTKKLYCWGDNTSGEIGDGTDTHRYLPVEITNKGDLSGKDISSISVGHDYSCAIADGQAYCWGANIYGQLGLGVVSPYKYLPAAVNNSGALADKNILTISAGFGQTCAVASDNLAYCWGLNEIGQLGIGNNVPKYEAQSVVVDGALEGTTIRSIDAGDKVTCAINSSSQIFCWGQNGKGNLGNNSIISSNEPVAIVTTSILSGKKISYFANGGNNTVCAVDTDKKGYCWGNGSLNGFVSGDLSASRIPVAASKIGNGADSSLIAAMEILDFSVSRGGDFGCLVATINEAGNGNKIYCWGKNESGQLAYTPPTSSLALRLVNSDQAILSGLTFSRISTGSNFTCLLADNNKVYCWGDNSFGQLGNATNVGGHVPVKVGEANIEYYSKDVSSITAGTTHACATMSDDSVYCWGEGFGNSPALQGVSAKPGSVSAGNNYTCYIDKSDNLVKCFGTNATVVSATPVATTAKTVVSGIDAACLISATDEKVSCWGNRQFSHTGVLSGKKASSLFVGRDNICVTDTNGRGYCSGKNNYGQLGDNTSIDKSEPTSLFESLTYIKNFTTTY